MNVTIEEAVNIDVVKWFPKGKYFWENIYFSDRPYSHETFIRTI